jgi:hypothetical protein
LGWGHGALGEGLFKNNGKCSSLSAWDKALGEEDLKKTVDGTDGVKSFPSVRFLALGEDLFPVSRIPDRSSPSVALGEGFPEYIWHSGKPVAPVVAGWCKHSFLPPMSKCPMLEKLYRMP